MASIAGYSVGDPNARKFLRPLGIAAGAEVAGMQAIAAHSPPRQ